MNATITDIDCNRDAAIKRIRTALRTRSGKPWSVKGGRGTAWGWITIESPPSRQVDGDNTAEELAELATLLGLNTVHNQGVLLPAGSNYWREYTDRAEGRTPSVVGESYWD